MFNLVSDINAKVSREKGEGVPLWVLLYDHWNISGSERPLCMLIFYRL